MTEVDNLWFRDADAADAAAIATLHADSWRRHYRGFHSDSYLDGDVAEDRLRVWSERFATTPAGATFTVLAEDAAGLVGFSHVIFDADPQWGSLVDNLHVRHGSKRRGLGSELMARSAQAILDRGTGLYLWVIEANHNARAFYEARGGECVERGPLSPPGGVAGRLVGEHFKLRMAWRDPSVLLQT